MAIRDVVTRGFGNGTYSPGVNKLPTRGYSIAELIPVPLSVALPSRRDSAELPSRITSVELPARRDSANIPDRLSQ